MFKKLLKPVLISLAILLLLAAVFIGLVYAGVFGQLYTREELKRFKNETASVVNKLFKEFFRHKDEDVRMSTLNGIRILVNQNHSSPKLEGLAP